MICEVLNGRGHKVDNCENLLSDSSDLVSMQECLASNSEQLAAVMVQDHFCSGGELLLGPKFDCFRL